MGPRAGLDRCGKSRTHRDSIPGPTVQPAASRYTDYATRPTQQHTNAWLVFTEKETAPNFDIMSDLKWTEYVVSMCNKPVSKVCDNGTLSLALLGFCSLSLSLSLSLPLSLSIDTTDMHSVVCLSFKKLWILSDPF